MHDNLLRLFSLQLFADGAPAGGSDGGGASATGESAADAGQQNTPTERTLEDLGVPKEKAEKYRATKAKRAAQAATAEEPEEMVPAEEPKQTEEPKQDPAAAAYTWDDVVKNPEFNQRMQDIVKARTKKMRGQLDDLAPMLEVIAKQYDIDVSDLSKADFKALSKAVTEDDRYFEDRAVELGLDVATVRRLDTLEADKRRRDAEDTRRKEDEEFREHMAKLQQQAVVMQQRFPGFNLSTEMENPTFRRMTSPFGGLTVEQAYYALHHAEIEQAKQAETARAVSTAISNSIQAGRSRPQENGTQARSSSGVQPKLYSQMTREERAAHKAMLIKKARGY